MKLYLDSIELIIVKVLFHLYHIQRMSSSEKYIRSSTSIDNVLKNEHFRDALVVLTEKQKEDNEEIHSVEKNMVSSSLKIMLELGKLNKVSIYLASEI